MKTIQINNDWRFHLGDCPQAWEKRYIEREWKDIELPHDWSVTLPFSKEYSSGTGYLAAGIGWYRKSFRLPEELRGKEIHVCFDGVYKNSQVWLNGYYLGKRPNGYVPFSYNISDRATFGDDLNVISVKVEHTDIADSRWFTGSGITRKVQIRSFERVYVKPSSIFFKTIKSSPEIAEIEIESNIINNLVEDSKCKVEFNLIDDEGNKALSIQESVDIVASSQKSIKVTGALKAPKLWDIDNPYLYKLEVILTAKTDNEVLIDTQEIMVGVRSFVFDHDNGFSLNEKPMKIKGLCVHHDAGCLGAAVYKQVWKRRLEKFKELGCNAIRMSHNPGMSELYDLCDEMGFLVMDEAFDEWEGVKNKWAFGHNVYPPVHQGYFTDFPQWHKRDLEAMVLRDRNHPSIIMWSVGNEIDYPNDPYCHPLFTSMTGNNDKDKPEEERMYNSNRPNAERLIPIAKELRDIVYDLDDTRPITTAAAFPELSAQIGFIDPFDVVSYNYKEAEYEKAHKQFTDKALLGSENGHELENWYVVSDNKHVCGQFLWTGIDFLGEAFGWPIRGSEAGLLTLAGYEKPLYYYRKSLWAQGPSINILTKRKDENLEEFEFVMNEKWNYIKGEKIEVRCYTNVEDVDLYLNEKCLGTKKYNKEQGYISWDVDYKDGVLLAVGKKEGIRVVEDTLHTAKAACDVKLAVWDETDDELLQVEVVVVDDEGVRVPEDSTKMHITVNGGGKLLGIENGDQADLTEYSAHYRRAYKGRMIVYIKKTSTEAVELIVKGEGLKKRAIKI